MSKTLILDYSKWRCGDNSINQLGEGDTALLNKEGYMCCLGQFAKQLSDEVQDKDILGIGIPEEISIPVPKLVSYDDEYDIKSDTSLTTNAIDINDDIETTPEEKIEKLQELFKGYDLEIQVVNKPKKG